jgi:hypothetical protein
MSTPTTFQSAEQFRRAAAATAASVLPDEDAETLPVPVKVDGGVAVLIMYYRESGPPDHRTVAPPHHAMHLDGGTGKVLRFWSTDPDELGIAQPTAPVPGVDYDRKMIAGEFVTKRKRLLEISSDVWNAWASGNGVDAAAKELAAEYWALFSVITKKEVAPFYVQASPDFFQWVRKNAGNP